MNQCHIPKRAGYPPQRSFRTQAHHGSTRAIFEDTRNPLQNEKNCDRLEKDRDSFFSGHHVELDAAGRAIAPARRIKKLQDESSGEIRHLSWVKPSQATISPGKGPLGPYQRTDSKSFDKNDGRLATYGGSSEGQEATFQPLNIQFETRDFKASQGYGDKELKSEELHEGLRRVLSVHPDYLLRRQILEELRQRWFTLSSEGWHDLIIGLIRDKQIESAVAVLQSAQQVDILIAPWLYDMLIYNLCDVGEFEEVLSILRFRVNSGEQHISGTVWYYILDTASSALHHYATLYAWRKRVEPNYLNPSSGICLNVLNTAARHSDLRLATDVIRVLGNRNQTLQIYHYEALVESYLPSDLRTALMLLTLMTSTGVPPTESSTRAIAVHLRQGLHLAERALLILGELREQGRPIPVEAVNVIIESFIYHGKSEIALETYKTLHTLCSSGPVTRTFNVLLCGCRGRKEMAMFLASEMVALKVLPDEMTYDRLILVCMESSRESGMNDAWRYFEEMREAGWWPQPGTAMAMARRCCQKGDERIWGLQSDGKDGHGIDKSTLQRLVDAGWMKGEEGMKGSTLLELMDADDPWA
ncbi:MAG: hypothetical protein Q9197_003384 [Variospora fuerteventurae]